MVLFYKSTVVDPPATIYIGDDKEENELLIQYGWPEDVWFHVDNLSSPHVYLRLRPELGETWETIPDALLIDCAQLTKEGSIQGHKKKDVTIIYTPWSNLKKTGAMATGQVGFHNNKLVRKHHVAARDTKIINRLEKTRVKIDSQDGFLSNERDKRDAKENKERSRFAEQQKKEAQRLAEERRRLKYQKEHMYDDLHTEENLAKSSNQDRESGSDDDFW